MTDLADLTTLRVGGPARELVVADDELTLLAAVRDADSDGVPVLLVAGGSNLVVNDTGFDGRVVLIRTRGIATESDSCGGAWVTAAAGESWDSLVERSVAEGWAGVEALSGIPGSVGATPIQNVGAYGQEAADVIARVRTFDRVDGVQRTFAAADCGFGYRTSRFKAEPGRFLILEVTLQMRLSEESEPIRYTELAHALGTELGSRATLVGVRDAVLALRRSKGMVLDPDDHDTWSVGSFFVNPVLEEAAAAGLPADAPRFAMGAGRVKTSAAWLIDHASTAGGYTAGAAALSGRHVLAITNRGGATTADVLTLAREVRDQVRSVFSVTLEPEPTLVGCSLDPV